MIVIGIVIHDLTSACSAGKVTATARCILLLQDARVIQPPARIEAPTPGYTLFDFVAACGRSTGVPLWLACSRWSMAFQSLHHSAEGGGLNVVFEFGGSAMLWLECWGEDEGKDEMHVILYE
jgi:hypothetical protein